MITTPICDFLKQYAEKDVLRLHMPGHKGQGKLGVEQYDITEVSGADSLYEAAGIIHQSEQNASALFGCPTYYSAEGSSLAIRAMVYLAMQHAKARGKQPKIAAGRNAHKVFLSAVTLLDVDVAWIAGDSYLSCKIDAETLEKVIEGEHPTAVYVTSPDYLGNITDVAALAEVAHRHDCLLLVDNAHGAYLKFLSPSMHPVDLGADLCADSAHKTLPVLTGGAYLHIGAQHPHLVRQAKTALALVGSTSPSYLIMQSLDAANAVLDGAYRAELAEFVAQYGQMKSRLTGWGVVGTEPLKLTIETKPRGYYGTEVAQILRAQGIEGEFADPDYVVFMITPEIGKAGLDRLEKALMEIPAKTAILEAPPKFHLPQRALSIRVAAFSESEVIPVAEGLGRILASPTVGCPPAVPVVACGERIDEAALNCFRYYGINTCTVVR